MPEYPDRVSEVIEDSQSTIGSQIVTNTDDLRAIDVLEKMYEVLKKIEFQLSLLTNEEIKENL